MQGGLDSTRTRRWWRRSFRRCGPGTTSAPRSTATPASSSTRDTKRYARPPRGLRGAAPAGHLGARAERVWTEAKDADDLRRRIEFLPGFGRMKITALGSVLAKRYGLPQAQELVPNFPTLGDVDSPQALESFQAAKRAYKASMKAARAG